MIKNLEHRIASLEARQPPLKSDWQRFLERITDEELTAIEFNFWKSRRSNTHLSRNLSKRIVVLEALIAADNAPKVCLPPLDCDPNRRLARYAAYFGGQQWECTGSPEQKARRDTNLIRYREYFDNPVAYKTTNESLDDSALIKLKWLD